jgi:hypothetical protein
MSDPQKFQPSVAPQTSAAKPAPETTPQAKTSQPTTPQPAVVARKPEIGGPKGPEPTRYGDWEKGGRCVDF